MSEKEKDLIVNIQFFIINALNALLAGGIMQLWINYLLDGQIIPFDSLKHILVFSTIFVTSVILGYIMWLLFTLLSLLIVIEIGKRY